MSAGVFSDRANPIVLQEVRRGLRTRVFSISFVLLLLACALIALVAYGTYTPGDDDSGKGTFIAVFACLSVVGFFMLPYSAYRSLVREREERTWPLLVLTGLSPRRILAGKVGSFALQAVLYASAIAPFLLFAYLLQGVSLVVVAAVLGLSVAYHLFLSTSAVAAATFGETRLVRGALHFVVLGALFGAATSGFSFGVAMVSSHGAGDLSSMLTAAGVAAWLMLSYGLVLFAVAVSRLTFDADNTVLWPRVALFLHWAGCSAICWGVVLSGSRSHDLGLVLGLLGGVHAFLAGLFSACTVAGLSRRLRQRPPRITFAGLLLPGAARGLRFSVLLVALFVASGAGLLILEDRASITGRLTALAGFGALAVLYISLPIALGRGPLRRWLGTTPLLQVFGVLLVILAMGLPPLVALVADVKVDHEGLNYLNPVVAVVHLKEGDSGPEKLPVLWALAATVFYVAHRLSSERDQEAERG